MHSGYWSIQSHFNGMRCTLHPNISPFHHPSRFARSQYVLRAQSHAFCLCLVRASKPQSKPVPSRFQFEHSIVLPSQTVSGWACAVLNRLHRFAGRVACDPGDVALDTLTIRISTMQPREYPYDAPPTHSYCSNATMRSQSPPARCSRHRATSYRLDR